MTGLEKAIKKAGSAQRLGQLLGVTKMAVSLWKKEPAGAVPAKRVLPIYILTGVTPHELRPDLYPNPTDGLPQPE